MYQYRFDFAPQVVVKQAKPAPQVDSPWNEVTDLEPELLQLELFYQTSTDKHIHS